MQENSIINLLNLDLVQLTSLCSKLGEKPYRAKQIFKWIHKFGITDFSQMSDLSKKFREKLEKISEVKAPTIKKESIAKDGTRKWLMSIDDSNLVETVYIPEKKRATLCISSQVGCALNCSFCSTGKAGFNRNLSTAEIIGQVWQANRQDLPDVTNVVLMGMGEPLLNLDNVVLALNIMRDDNAYGLPAKRVTLSTSGLIPGIQKLAELNFVSLALSLHAPNDELRNELVPINKKYPIKEVLSACKDYASNHKRFRVTIEYVMLKGINDSMVHAKQLVDILKTVPCKVNLIPFNPFPGSAYECSELSVIMKFSQHLLKNGIVTTIRKTRGDDIDAACGQLVGKIKDRTQRSRKFKEQMA